MQNTHKKGNLHSKFCHLWNKKENLRSKSCYLRIKKGNLHSKSYKIPIKKVTYVVQSWLAKRGTVLLTWDSYLSITWSYSSQNVFCRPAFLCQLQNERKKKYLAPSQLEPLVLLCVLGDHTINLYTPMNAPTRI